MVALVDWNAILEIGTSAESPRLFKVRSIKSFWAVGRDRSVADTDRVSVVEVLPDFDWGGVTGEQADLVSGLRINETA